MSVDAAGTATSWLIVIAIAAAAVLGFVLKRLAARVLAVSVLAMVVLLLVALRVEISDIARTHHDELCADRVSFYGIDLTAPADSCPPATDPTDRTDQTGRTGTPGAGTDGAETDGAETDGSSVDPATAVTTG